MVKQIAAEYGEDVLGDSTRLKAFFRDPAKDGSKPLSIAFGRCIEQGAYNALKTAAIPDERRRRKVAIAQRVRDEQGIDITLCGEALDLLEAALFGETSTAQPAPVAAVIKWFGSGDFVKINSGTFAMGSPEDEAERDDDEALHQVTVSSFYMGKYEVTRREWREMMGNNPGYFKGDNLPVELISWYDAVEYCNTRSLCEELTPAYRINGADVSWNRNAGGYRLPTEAEWEYACRAGTTGPFNTGNNITADQANYNGNYPYSNNPRGVYRKSAVEAGSFAPNPWGLYNMHGNVWEWCWDWYGSYGSGSLTDPAGLSAGNFRVLRGGSWSSDGGRLRSAYRYGTTPNRGGDAGFRLVRSGSGV
jgi:formylglycine-generating enzyme required for sulfatase activity